MDTKVKNKQKINLSDILTAFTFIIILGVLFIGNLIYTPPEISLTERRTLAKRPDLTFKTIENKKFMTGFEDYALDSFIGRDIFRNIKAFTLFNVFLQTDNNGLYHINGNIAKTEKLNITSVDLAGKYIEKLINDLKKNHQNLKFYYSVIPDKGYYLLQKTDYRSIDYEKIEQLLSAQINSARYIDIKNSLNADDYYKTDIHWDQSQLFELVDTLKNEMNFSNISSENFNSNILTGFKGTFLNQIALPLKSENLTYLTSSYTDNAIVHIQNGMTAEMELKKMYDPEAFDGVDPYDIFLSGPQTIITIENPLAQTERELYIFRDSFGSSLAPILTSAYKRIVLIDLRYIPNTFLEQFIDFKDDSDVLFLYSMQILNNPSVLQIAS